MQRRIIADRVNQTVSVEEWAGKLRGWRLVNIARRGGAGLCTVDSHEEIKRDLGRFRALQLAGYQSGGGGYFAELRVCPVLSCRSTIAIWVDAAGNPCAEPSS
jgi:hypothetical protein